MIAASDEAIEAAILRLVGAARPGASVCPSEVARALAAGEAAWRALLPAVRRVAAELAREGRLRVTQRGSEVDPLTARGPIRLRRP